jgi:hypothetical protein
MKKLRIMLPLLIPVLSLIYACGDYYSWWDHLRGRIIQAEGVQRLSSHKGFPDIMIFDDETIFEDLLKLIKHNTENQKVIDLFKNGTSPTAIIRVGGTLQPDVGDNLPSKWPNPKFAPASSPVAVVYNYHRPPGTIDGDDIEPIGNLGDLRDWIVDSRNRERFVVYSLLMGLLSIAVVVLDQTRSEKNK